MVGAPRFELGTPCTPCKCATRLRHAPTRLFFFDSRLYQTRDRGPSRELIIIRRFGILRCDSLAPQHLQQLLQLDPHLLHNLLALAHIRARFFAGELLPRAADREALLVEQAADLPDDNDVLALVITPVAAAFYRL